MRPGQQPQSVGPWQPCGLGTDSGPSLCSWGLGREGVGQARAAGGTKPQYTTTAATTPPLGETAHLCCGHWVVRLCKLLPSALGIRVLGPCRREALAKDPLRLASAVTSCQQGLDLVGLPVAGMESYPSEDWAGIPRSEAWADTPAALSSPLLAGLLGSAGVLDVVSQPTGHARSLRSSPLRTSLDSILLTWPAGTRTPAPLRNCHVHHFWARPDLLWPLSCQACS